MWIDFKQNEGLAIKKKGFLRNMMLSHWLCFTWKFFMVWFHKILKLIFQKQPSCSKNICTEHWRKLLYLTAFLEIFWCLKNNDSVEDTYKVLLFVLFIYFQSKIKFSHSIWSIWLFWNHYFSACENLLNSSWHFWKHKLVYLQIFHQSSVPSNITPLSLFSSKIIYLSQKS